MYFTNITNEELQYFKREAINNFNINLTDILSSNLFKIEEIVSNSIYRIYPLFNCEKIISSESDNIILENKCIIVTKKDNESYFNFISKELETIYCQNKLTGYKNVGDSLTTEEFNGLVQVLKHGVPFKEEIKIDKSNIQGLYGEYIFNLNSSTVVDDGILITNETLESLGTVLLDNPIFKDSQYVLKLNVYHISDININNENTSNIEVTPLEITLNKYVAVEIPFSTFEKDYIVGFDATVEITHNKPVIRQSNSIRLSVSLNQIIIGESVIIYANYTDSDNNPIADAQITFKSNNNVIGQATTNNRGIATLTYTPSAIATYNLTASCDDIESTSINLVVNKKTPTLSFTANRRVQDRPLIDFYGKLSYNGTPLEDATLTIVDGNGTVIVSPMTDNLGEINEVLVEGALGGSFKMIYAGNSEYNRVESEYIIVAPILSGITLTEENNKTVLSYDDGDEAVLVAQGLDANNQPIVAPNVPIEFWQHYTDCPSTITTSWLLTINRGDTMSLKLMMEQYGMMSITDGGITVDNGFDMPVDMAVSISKIYYSDGILSITDINEEIYVYNIENFNNKFIKQSSSGTYDIKVYLGTEDTDNTGKAKWYYDSQGINDISFVGENGNISSNLLNIDDCYKYITGANDISSTFQIVNTGASYTLSIEDNAYKFVKQNDTQERGIFAQLYEVPADISSYQIEMVVKWNTSNASSFNNVFKMSDSVGGQVNSLHCGTWSSSKILGYIKDNVNHRYNPSGRLNPNIWYKYIARYNHQTGEIYTAVYNLDNNTLVVENGQTDTFNTIPKKVILVILLASSTNYVKSIKVRKI